jgi:hypothetical protein
VTALTDMALCVCPGSWEGHPNLCEHHKPGEQCPNAMRSGIAVIPDPNTGAPIPGSERGFCQECWDNYYKVDDADESVA